MEYIAEFNVSGMFFCRTRLETLCDSGVTDQAFDIRSVNG